MISKSKSQADSLLKGMPNYCKNSSENDFFWAIYVALFKEVIKFEHLFLPGIFMSHFSVCFLAHVVQYK